MGKDVKTFFFLGKGGVGKSTTSSLFALELALKGEKVLIVSMDPAHNLGDIFETNLRNSPVIIGKNLSAIEIDLEYWIENYLQDVKRQMNRSYAYLTALSLDEHFDIIRHSPGIEEYALIKAFSYLIKKHSDFDKIIFDMPPTGLTLKFFALPRLSQLWIEKLIDLRNAIIKKKEIVTKIKFGKVEIEKDKILNKLGDMFQEYNEIKKLLENKNLTELILVTNQDKLSLAESKLIVRKLTISNLEISRVFLNKFQQEAEKPLDTVLNRYPVTVYPLYKGNLTGLQNLKEYLETNGFV